MADGRPRRAGRLVPAGSARTLGLFDGVRDRLRRPAESELAVWLHDVVYDPRAADKELPR